MWNEVVDLVNPKNNKSVCSFCSEIDCYDNYQSGNQTEAIFHDTKHNRYILVLEQFRHEYAKLEISYCPICGRKLEY